MEAKPLLAKNRVLELLAKSDLAESKEIRDVMTIWLVENDDGSSCRANSEYSLSNLESFYVTTNEFLLYLDG